jgi:membrane protease YdiL (CAAX protease family)
MPAGINPGDQMVLLAVLVIIVLLFFIADFIIFCYWLSFKYKEYSYQQAYGPIIKFPPRDVGEYAGSLTDQDTGLEPDVVPPPSSFAPAQFDFLSSTADGKNEPEEELEEKPEDKSESRISVDTEPESSFDGGIDAAIQEPQLSDEATMLDAGGEYPAIPSDPLEDMRPIDPMVLAASGGLRSPFATTWSLVHPFVGIQVVLLAVNLLSLILLIPVFGRFMSDPQNEMKSAYFLGVTIICLLIQNAGFVGITAYLLKGYGTSLKRIGLRAPSAREIGLGLAYGAALCGAAMLLEKGLDIGASHFVSRQFIDRMGKLNDSLSAGGLFEHIRSVPLQIWFIIAGAIAAPIGEEVFFRGLLYNGLKKRWGVTAGVIVSGVCFALIHFAPLSIIIIIPMGCLLALAYERTKSLWVTILMHSVNNGVQLLIAMYAINHSAGH